MNDGMIDLGCLPNGAHLFRKPNEAGGYTYYTDEVGGGCMVWDTCLVSESTILAAILSEHHRAYLDHLITKRDWEPKDDPEMEIERMAATGGSWIPPDILAKLKAKRDADSKRS